MVGRPIRDAPDPLEAAQAIQAEIEAALEELNSKSSEDPEESSNLQVAG